MPSDDDRIVAALKATAACVKARKYVDAKRHADVAHALLALWAGLEQFGEIYPDAEKR
jgi:hypothetical protein